MKTRPCLKRGAVWAAGILLFFTAAGCRRSEPGAAKTAALPPPAETAVAIAPDHSLPSAEYIAMGMPAADRPWSPADYAQAQRVLTELAAGDATRLPRAESRTSPEMFARIVDPANLELAESLGSDPLQKFASIGMNLHAPVNEILKIYIAAASKAGYFDREQVDLFLLTQAIGVRLWKYADLFFAGLSPDDPTYPARMQGLGQMRDGLALVVSGSLTTLTEKHAYRRDVLLRFAAGMKAYLPDLVERLGPQSRLEVPARLEQMARAETDPELRKAIEELRSALRPAGE